MHRFVTITGSNIQEFIHGYDAILCSIRPSRTRAKTLALWEMYYLLEPVGGVLVTNGPLGEIAQQIAFFVPKAHRRELPSLLKNAGYTKSFYRLEFHPQGGEKAEFFWKKVPFNVEPLFRQDKELFESQAPHLRKFQIADRYRQVKTVVGYRGDGSQMGRRGLPVEDARLMVNLAAPQPGQTLLDPFAGTGGLLLAAGYAQPELRLLSADRDTVLEPGLSAIADIHFSGDACLLPQKWAPVDRVVTEPPFVEAATPSVAAVLTHVSALMAYDGRLVLMCGAGQQRELAWALEQAELFLLMEQSLDRQGTPVVLSLWHKEYLHVRERQPVAEAIEGIL